jgi:hypothetical protein
LSALLSYFANKGYTLVIMLFVRRLYSSLQLSTELCSTMIPSSIFVHDMRSISSGTNLSYIRSVTRGLNKLTSSNYREALLLL